MMDYLKEVGTTGRVLTIILLGLTSATLAAMTLLVVVALFRAGPPVIKPGPMIAGGLFLSLLPLSSLTSAWALMRLLREDRSSNQVAVLPVRLIQAFGYFMLVGAVASAVMGLSRTRFAAGGIVLALSMISLSWLIRRKARRDDAERNAAESNATIGGTAESRSDRVPAHPVK